MREILFRGKRIDNGEWVYSQTVFSHLDNFYIPAQNLKCTVMQNLDTVGNISVIRCKDGKYFFKVQTETVGQYTGLTDKNGKKIFEGDIVEYPIESGGYKGENIHEVVFENRHGTAYFGIKMSNIETWGFDMEVPAKLMKVIGNIYDNPDLLGGDDK